MSGSIRVGRRIYNKNGTYSDPNFEGFTKIICMTKSSEYGSLSPYELKNDKGHNLENIWQFSKVYTKVPKTSCTYSRYDSRLIWDHPAEVHITETGVITKELRKWRKKGFECKDAVRYPVGYSYRHQCLGAIKTLGHGENISDFELLDYIESRKKIYLPLFLKMVKNKPQFLQLKNRVKSGENLLIIEVDGPHQETLEYYKEKYSVNDNFIENNTILVTKENMNVLLNDDKHPFGHGYCLAIAILEWNFEYL